MDHQPLEEICKYKGTSLFVGPFSSLLPSLKAFIFHQELQIEVSYEHVEPCGARDSELWAIDAV